MSSWSTSSSVASSRALELRGNPSGFPLFCLPSYLEPGLPPSLQNPGLPGTYYYPAAAHYLDAAGAHDTGAYYSAAAGDSDAAFGYYPCTNTNQPVCVLRTLFSSASFVRAWVPHHDTCPFADSCRLTKRPIRPAPSHTRDFLSRQSVPRLEAWGSIQHRKNARKPTKHELSIDPQ